MRYDLLVLDLDGTTVPNDQHALPSSRVTDAVRKARNHIHVVIATGRPWTGAKPIITALGITDPCIVGNGFQIVDPQKDVVIEEKAIPPDAIPIVADVAQTLGVPLMCFDGSDDVTYEDGLEQRQRLLSMYFPVLTRETADTVELMLREAPGITAHRMPSWEQGQWSIDVTNGNASKLHGLATVLSLLGVSKERVIGVGDGHNDFPLLLASGLKVAMGNAIDDLKAIADFIAPPVSEDGVAVVIEKFILDS